MRAISDLAVLQSMASVANAVAESRHRGSLRVWRWQKPKAARELCRATLGRTAGVLRFHSSLEELTDKGVLCSGNYSEQFYTDAIQPSDLA
jgi:hypothetical protein